MRAVLSVLVLVLVASTAFAGNKPPTEPTTPIIPQARLKTQGNSLLQLSPMYVEIRDSLAVADVRQKQLLVELTAAVDEAGADAVVRQLEALPLETLLTILRIQLRYAHDAERTGLEREIELRMLELTASGRI
jgi:hypothetical protein